MSTIPYTYILFFPTTNQYYYGVRWAKGCSPSDLFVSYFTSSSTIRKLIKEHGKEAFTFRVSRIFQTPKEAIDHETRFLKRVSAASNAKFLNKRENLPAYSPAGLSIIHHRATQKETRHDPKFPIPEGWIYGASPTHKLNNSLSKKGKPSWNKGKTGYKTGPCSKTRAENISIARSKTPKLTCPHCELQRDPGNYKKYHGDNCKANPNLDPKIWETISTRGKVSYQNQLSSGTYSKPKAKIGNFTCPNCGTTGTNWGNMMKNHFSKCKTPKTNDILPETLSQLDSKFV